MNKLFSRSAWSGRLLIRWLITAFGVVLLLTSLYMFHDNKTLRGQLKFASQDYFKLPFKLEESHPIDWLIHDAREKHAGLLQTQSHSLEFAARRYRARRDRHPPPGFDKWFEHAMKTDAIVIEDFFDRIYDDLRPFWALDAKTTRARANSGEHVVRVRNGVAHMDGDTEGRVPWLQLWTDLVAEMAEHLPDVDMPINYMDEPRILVPWEDMAKLVAKEAKERKMLPKEKIISNYKGLEAVDAARGPPYAAQWFGADQRQYWDMVRETCPPLSPSREVPALTDFSLLPSLPYTWKPPYSYEGYVVNYTGSMDPCVQPHLRSLHGNFVEPLSMKSTKELIPLFGGSKLRANNEIIIPGAMYLADDPFYSGGDAHGPPWAEKKDALVWRGAGSGGRNKDNNWTHFHRQRLIEMLNGTTVHGMEVNGNRAMTFDLPPIERYNTTRRRNQEIGTWLSEFSNAGFVHLLCLQGGDRQRECDWLTPHLSVVDNVPMAEQFTYKFLPDADGNSFSGRFRAFLLSTSVPLKATVYTEWHDDRLVPWLHFVPLDNTFQDIYGVLDFFTDGDEPKEGWTVDKVLGRKGKGDMAAQWLAEQGQRWSQKVLRREDMGLYVWRLLLEWARICDENRDTLGFVEDIV